MAKLMPDVAWEACLVEPVPDRAPEAYARRKIGIPHPSIRYFASLRWLGGALVDLNPAYGLLMHLVRAVAGAGPLISTPR